jgi:hypothetical protein
MRLIPPVAANFLPTVSDALQSTLTKCGFLQPTVTRIAEDCDRVNRYISTAPAALDFEK